MIKGSIPFLAAAIMTLVACNGKLSKELHGSWHAVSVQSKSFAPDSIYFHFNENGQFTSGHELENDDHSGLWKLGEGGRSLTLDSDLGEADDSIWQLDLNGDTLQLSGYPADSGFPVTLILRRYEP